MDWYDKGERAAVQYIALAPITQSVESPMPQAAIRVVQKGFPPIGAIDADEVGGIETEGGSGAADGFRHAVRALNMDIQAAEKRVVLRWQPVKPGFTFLGEGAFTRADTVHAKGKEQSAFGRNQPPFVLQFFRAEPSGRFQAGAGRPTAEAVPFRQFGGFRPGCLLKGMPLPEITLRGKFARPVGMFILTIRIHKGQRHRGSGGVLIPKHIQLFET
ncbi:MAG: hypothetical protein BWY09_01764 [Candidatus Hydrogenedentes bacterium ADurb.Bin179]|nr:MAG: hypothetical protein BWY09_01764 [Candidatus Hydrogenedentes bacterium ADurb.Bin179]